MDIKPIAKIENDFTDKFAIPRQSGIAEKMLSKIVFEEKYADKNAVSGIDGFSHLWLIWGFSKNVRDNHSLTVRPPRLGGNKRIGVFASRSPFRPNNLGLSSVRLEEIKYDNSGSPVLIVSGADLLNGTPIYDIKPYVAYTDCHGDAVCGFVDKNEFHHLAVNLNDASTELLTPSQLEVLTEILSQDPRPAYQEDSDRIYGFKFAGCEIKFKVEKDTLTVLSINNE